MAPITMTRISFRQYKAIGRLIITIFGVGYFLIMLTVSRKSIESYELPKHGKRNITIWSNDFHIRYQK